MTTDRPAVLVIDSDPKHLAEISRIVRTVVPGAESVAGIDETTALANQVLLIANHDGLHTDERRRLFEAVAADGQAPRLLLLHAAARDYRMLFQELQQHGLANLLAHDREISPRELIVTLQKILRHDIFGLDKYFGWGVESFGQRIRSSRDTRDAVDEATGFASGLDIHPRLVENLATVVHELLTNALYNAPVDGAGAPRFMHLPRTTEVTLEPAEEVILTVCCDGQHLGVSVSDSFGAMTRDQSLDYLVKCMKREATQEPRPSKGGAGLGLYMTFDSLNHLVLNIRPTERTEVIGLIDIRGSYRDFVKRGKSFNIFVGTRTGE
ncbi:MAG TPA: hypothetical protein VML75_21940 [Kofleriaceae bacterium]|nr:hypothetical protein [Kofleriaceae bacterium]